MPPNHKDFGRGIEVRFMGSIEVASPRKGRPGYRWVDGYSVIVDGHETAPWLQYRAASEEAKTNVRRREIDEREATRGEPAPRAVRLPILSAAKDAGS